MKNGFEISIILPASPDEIYNAWLSSEGHSAMTGGGAQIDGKAGGKFSAWDGYISGQTLEQEPARRILQAWRTSEFPDEAPDSRLEILLQPVKEGTRLTLIHSDIPEDQVESYRHGWQENYFDPMMEYFGK